MPTAQECLPLGAKLTAQSPQQAADFGVAEPCPFKADTYRY